MASINDLRSLAGTAQEPQDTSRSFTPWQPSQFDVMALGDKRPPPRTVASLGWPAFDPWRFAPANAASSQTIANLAPGMELAARKARASYAIEPLPIYSDVQRAMGVPEPKIWNVSSPSDVEFTVYGEPIYAGTGRQQFIDGPGMVTTAGERVPVATRGSLLDPMARVDVRPVDWAVPSMLPDLLAGGGAAMPRRAASHAVQEARPAAQTLVELGRTGPNVAADTPQTLAALRLARDPKTKKIDNPPVRDILDKPARPFELDYPNLELPHGTPLEKTIDGAPLKAQFVAGRRVAGGEDHKLTEEEIRAIVAAITNRDIDTYAASGKSSQALGKYYFNPRSPETPGRVVYRKDLDDPVNASIRANVIGHEAGHMGSELTRLAYSKSKPKEVDKGELGYLYNLAATGSDTWQSGSPQTWHNWLTPSMRGYPAREWLPERQAEAWRTYFQNANTMKTVAPETAKKIREAWNEGPYAHIVQLNAAAPPGIAAQVAQTGQGQQMPQQQADPWAAFNPQPRRGR